MPTLSIFIFSNCRVLCPHYLYLFSLIVEYYAHIGEEPVEDQENLIDYVGKNHNFYTIWE